MTSKTKQSWITGATILGSAALISKLLGAAYRIPYQNITGDVGLAVYNKVYPLYSMLLILATAGFPIAVSKIVSERLALGDKKGAKRVFNISLLVLTITGIIFFLIMYLGSDFIANLMGNSQLSIAIKSVSFALLIVPPMAAIRGYYQGHQYMTPTAFSQVAEQIVRVTTILVLSYWFMANGYGVYYAGAGAVFGATTGAIVAFLVLLLYWKKIDRIEPEVVYYPESGYEQASTWEVTKKILYYSIPIAIGSLIVPLIGVVDSFSVTNILNYSVAKGEYWGFGSYLKGQNMVRNAEYWFGIYTRGQPLVQFAAFFATALFIALVPSISEAHANKNYSLIAKRSELALRLTLMIGLPAALGLAILAEPVNIMLYTDNVGTITLSILAFTIIFSTLFITSSGILQGIGKAMVPARNLFIGIIIKIVLNGVLIYFFHINGAAIATITTYAVVSTLNILDIRRYIGLKLGFMDFFIKPISATLIMGVAVYISMITLEKNLDSFIDSERLLMTVVALVAVVVGLFVYSFSLFLTGAITRSDLAQIPKYGTKMIKLGDKLKILKG